MPTLTQSPQTEPWRRRLYLPAYSVAEAARYARTSTSTVDRWQYGMPSRGPLVVKREPGKALSYLELAEIAVVAAFRTAGVSLGVIARAHAYLAQRFQDEFPFVRHRLIREGTHLLMHLREVEPSEDLNKLVVTDAAGQLAWKNLIGERFEEFDFENDLAVQWHVAGRESPVLIDPRVSFGAPAVEGIATWAIKGRYEAGESPDEIAEDFGLDMGQVREALAFEKVALAA